METIVLQSRASSEADAYYEAIAAAPQTEDHYVLRDHDAVNFIIGMGRIALDIAPFKNGVELLEYVIKNLWLDEPEILFPHKNLVVFFRLMEQRPVVLVSTSAVRLRAAVHELFGAVAEQTEQTLARLILERGESLWVELPDEGDPVDAVVVYRPDLVPFDECYEDLRKLGFVGVIMEPGLIEIPYEHWKGGVHMHVTPVKDAAVDGFCDFGDARLWGDVCFYVGKGVLGK